MASPQASQFDGGSGLCQAEYAASNSSFQKADSSLFWSSRPKSRASPKNPEPAFPLTPTATALSIGRPARTSSSEISPKIRPTSFPM